MHRRHFIKAFAATAISWPLAGQAQPNERIRRIGVLLGIAENDTQSRDGLAAFKKGLQGFGWAEGSNLKIEVRWAEADLDRMNWLAKELVNLQPDVLVAQTTAVVAALQRETKTIPIVFVVVSDPVGSGFVTSLPRPGGNITGFINIESSLGGKWIEMLKEIVPRANRAALLFNPDTAPYFAYYQQPFEAAAHSNGIEAVSAPVRTEAEMERAFAALGDGSAAGLIVMPDAFTATRRNLHAIISLAARHRVPTIYPYRFMISAGGLVSYGIDNVDLYRRAPIYIDRILRGAKPAELPVQLPTKFELAVNLKTAKALGLDIPATLLGRADEVIE